MLLVLTATAVVSVGITAALEYRIARRSIEQQSFQYLIAVREMKANQIEDYLRIIVDQAVTMAESRLIVEAMRDFREAFQSMKEDRLADELGEQDLRLYYQTEFFPRLESTGDAEGNLDDYWPRDETARRLQKIYIHDNPFETGSKHLLDDALDGSTYSQAHRQYHPSIRNFLERFGYYDIFLIDHETGKVVYSVFKEVDFGTSLIDGPYWGTNLAEAFQSARDAGRGKFKIVDFRPYAPSYGAQASFIATPIYDGDEVIGVLAFQMPVDRINDIMTSRQEWGRVGLGETGETYIVGDDLTLRNQSRFLIEDRENYLQMIKQLGVAFGTVRQIEAMGSSIGLQEVRTEGTLAAVGGASGTGIFPDYRGVPVFSAYRQLDVPDLNWAIMSEIDRAEALAPVRAMRNRSLALLAILFLVIVGVAIWFSGSLTRPIKRLAGIAAELAEGRLDRSISTDGRDGSTG
jgi:HAMP domain-containing protein